MTISKKNKKEVRGRKHIMNKSHPMTTKPSVQQLLEVVVQL